MVELTPDIIGMIVGLLAAAVAAVVFYVRLDSKVKELEENPVLKSHPPLTEQRMTQIETNFTRLEQEINQLTRQIQRINNSVKGVNELRPDIANHKAALQSAADFLRGVSTHVVQSRADIKTLASIIYDFLPDKGMSIVNATNVRLNELDKKLRAAQEDIGRIPLALDHL